MEHDPSKGFAKRVLQARLDAGAKRGKMLTQTEVAEQLGVTQVTIGRWESGAAMPDISTITRLAKALDTTAAWLAFAVVTADADVEPDPRKNKRNRGEKGA